MKRDGRIPRIKQIQKISFVGLESFAIFVYLLPVQACSGLGLMIFQTEHCFAFDS